MPRAKKLPISQDAYDQLANVFGDQIGTNRQDQAGKAGLRFVGWCFLIVPNLILKCDINQYPHDLNII